MKLLGLGQNCCIQARKQRRRPKSLYNNLCNKIRILALKICLVTQSLNHHRQDKLGILSRGRRKETSRGWNKTWSVLQYQIEIRYLNRFNAVSGSPSMMQALLSFILANFFLSIPATDLFSGIEFPFTVFTVILTFSLISSKFVLKGNLNNLTFVRKFLNLLIILLFAVVLRLTSSLTSFILHPNLHLGKVLVKW